MKENLIPRVFAHEGEDHSPEAITTAKLSSSSSLIIYVLLLFIVVIGVVLLLYNYGKRRK